MTATALDLVTALVVVDLQNAVLGFPYAHPIAGVAANAGRLAAAFRSRGLPVVLTKVTGSTGPAVRVDKPFVPPGGALMPNWAELVDDLNGRWTLVRIREHPWSGITSTRCPMRIRVISAESSSISITRRQTRRTPSRKTTEKLPPLSPCSIDNPGFADCVDRSDVKARRGAGHYSASKVEGSYSAFYCRA